jgi:hypothetical protein
MGFSGAPFNTFSIMLETSKGIRISKVCSFDLSSLLVSLTYATYVGFQNYVPEHDIL